MSSSGFQRDNHYVPRMYLKRWADSKKKVHAYRVLVPHQTVALWKRTSIKGVAYHEHLYTNALTGSETDELEKWLNREFESPAEEPIRRAVSGGRLSRGDWECLIRFAAAQDVRTPARLVETMRRWDAELQQQTQETLTSSVKAYAEAREAGIPIHRASVPNVENFPCKVTTHIEPGADQGTIKVEVIAGRALWLFGVRRLLTYTATALLGHKWTILRPPPDMRWLTSDDPFIKLNYYAPGKYDFKGGWGSPGTEILLPLGPEHMLFTKIGDRRPPDRDTRVPREIAAGFQRFTIEHAHRLVFAEQEDPSVELIRPRRIDPAAVRHETEQWKRWNDEQGQAERGVRSPPPLR
jgi:hypothetical protein